MARSPRQHLQMISFAAIALSAIGCGKKADHSNHDAALPEIVGFNEHIRPILSKNCAACHGGVKKSGGLSYVFQEEAIAIGASGNPSIVPGDADASYLIEKVSSTDPKFRMPPIEHGPALEDQQIALLRKWIDQGAEWEEHWAFQQPKEHAAPEVATDNWSRTDIDRFVKQRLDQEGLTPSPEADKGVQLRRVSFDLTGLPPTEAALDAFINDESPDAYEKVVDRLLASPQYGERWATLWLDLARYADSKGAGQDGPRTIYKFRDWVIRAFNDDMPFDQFTIKQIAGDLLPSPTFDDYVATAFHRNTHTEDEGGTDDEEFRVIALMDRVNTTWQVWHGTTFACVQCHSHPYDPFRHDEYYKFAAFFNNSQDADTRQDYPIMAFPKDEAKQVELGAQHAKQGELRQQMWQMSYDLEQASTWSWLDGLKLKTNKAKQLSFNIEQRDGREEFVFEGTPTRSNLEVIASMQAIEKPVQAMRMLVSPLNFEDAPYRPSPGFVVEKLTITHIAAADQKETKVPFDRVYRDEPNPFLWGDPKKGATGFAAYTRICNPRSAVFRLTNPLTIKEGDQLKFVIDHGRGSGEKELLLVRRGSLALTTDAAWRTLESQDAWVESKKEFDQLSAILKKAPTVSIPVMRERPAHLARGSKVFIRGNWTTLGEEVPPVTPASLHAFDDSDEPARLKMAQWLVDSDNPLTARVLVTRFWEQLFGTGIVETLEDFGSIGELPSHPELLDYLAYKFMHEYQWQMKPLLREMVLSSAYRQRSESTAELEARDPKNRLLARGPRNRMTGEMVRDQVLSLAGLLNDEMYGPPIKPPLPEGGWSPSHNASGDWVAHTDDRVFRRSIYIHWQRSSPYPLFTAFDAPMRDLCTDRRFTSNTPVQPLFTLNDPALFKAMQTFSKRMNQHSDDVAENIAYGYRLATTKQIPEAMQTELLQLHAEIEALYPEEEAGIKASHEANVERLLKEERARVAKKRKKLVDQAKKQKKDPPEDLPAPDSVKRGPEHDFNYSAELAAYDAVSSVLLNLDEVLNK